MSKPVEIEFLMRDRLSGGLNAAGKAVDSLGDRVDRVSQSITERIAAQREQVRYVEQSLKDLKRQYDRLAPGRAQTEMRAEIEACTRALEEDKAVLAGLRSEHEKNSATARGLTMELRQLLGNMAQMRLQGRQNSQEYQTMAQRAALLQDTLGDLRTQTKILAHDNSGLQGLMSGANGLAGAFTMATGVMGVFASENENLIKIQTRVQSVLAITMGLQQVMNALNKDSAFRLVTVVKAKNLLTAANHRLAVSLGISNAAATALMATLTLGLSAVVTGLIVLWDRYADSQEDASAKAKERVEVEKDGRAQMIKTRFEIESTLRSLKEFTGSKEQEKAKVEELNRKYGESFGYYDTIAEWYDVLLQKGEAYIQMLFLQAKVQSLVNRAADVDEQVNTLQATPANDVKGAHGWWYRFFAKSGAAEAGLDVRDIDAEIDASNEQIKAKLVEAAQEQRDAYLDEARKLTEDAANVAKEFVIGGHIKPDKPDPEKSAKQLAEEREREMAAEKQRGQELSRLRWQNEQSEIDQMQEGSDRRIRQIRLDYDKAIAEIDAQEKKWRDAQGGELTSEQSTALTKAYGLAKTDMDGQVRGVENDEVAKGKAKLKALLDQYKDYDQRRRDIDAAYAADMSILQSEQERLQKAGEDATQVEASVKARTDAYRADIKSLEGDILQSTDFYDRLFSDTSEKGYKVLRDFYAQAKGVLANAKMDDDGVDISIPYKDADGKFVSKSVKVTVAEFQKMKKQVKAIQKDLERNNPFAAFRNSWKDLSKAMKEGGDVSGAVKNLNTKGKELTSTIRGWGDSLGAVFGERFSKSMDEIMNFCEGTMDLGTGIAQIWSGDIVGGISSALSGLSAIISMFTSWKEKMEEMKREWYIAEIETNRAIRERAEAYAADRSKITDIIKDVELLNWLIEKGYAKPASVSVWEAQSAALAQYQKDLVAESVAYDQLWAKLQGSNGYYEWGNSLNGGSMEWSLRGYSAEQIELWHNQNKLSDAARDYYDAWVKSGKSIEELKQHIEECYQSMQEMVMGVSFDSFLSNARDALKAMRSDISALGEFTENTLSDAILNAFMYRYLAKVLEPLYDELSDAFINDTADKSFLEDWKRRFEAIMKDANDRLDDISDATGVEINGDNSATQSGKTGALTTITQDQGTKLEGLMTSMQIHEASMDENLDNIAEGMGAALDSLRRIKENTDVLPQMYVLWQTIKRDGLKAK